MIGYYVHHHGAGPPQSGHHHLQLTCDHRSPHLTSLDVPSSHPFADIVVATEGRRRCGTADPAAHGALHWVPQHHHGLTARMALIARWVEQTRPAAVVVDVSAEVAAFVRLLGVPVIVMAVPGDRTDAPHQFVHQLADHIVATWPRELYDPSWLRRAPRQDQLRRRNQQFRAAGRYAVAEHDGRSEGVWCWAVPVDPTSTRPRSMPPPPSPRNPLEDTGPARWAHATSDPWPDICAADVVVTHAGQGCVADVAAARRPAIVLPQSRPFGEQDATGERAAPAPPRHGDSTVAEPTENGKG